MQIRLLIRKVIDSDLPNRYLCMDTICHLGRHYISWDDTLRFINKFYGSVAPYFNRRKYNTNSFIFDLTIARPDYYDKIMDDDILYPPPESMRECHSEIDFVKFIRNAQCNCLYQFLLLFRSFESWCEVHHIHKKIYIRLDYHYLKTMIMDKIKLFLRLYSVDDLLEAIEYFEEIAVRLKPVAEGVKRHRPGYAYIEVYNDESKTEYYSVYIMDSLENFIVLLKKIAKDLK